MVSCNLRRDIYEWSLFVKPLIFSCSIKTLLYPLCVVAGLCYGSMFSLVLALTGDLFGAEHIGTNYGLLDLGTRSSDNKQCVEMRHKRWMCYPYRHWHNRR